MMSKIITTPRKFLFTLHVRYKDIFGLMKILTEININSLWSFKKFPEQRKIVVTMNIAHI